MQPIDLRVFADHSVKIPPVLLNSTAMPETVATWKILGAHILDVWVATSVTVMTCGQLSHFKNILVSDRFLQKSGPMGATMPLTIFMIILWGGYFFSYFLNDGQSLGLYAIKKRIRMKEKSFREAMRWSVVSTLTCLTGGVSGIYLRVNENYVSQDHLYQELIQVKEVHVMNLLDQTYSEEELSDFSSKAA